MNEWTLKTRQNRLAVSLFQDISAVLHVLLYFCFDFPCIYINQCKYNPVCRWNSHLNVDSALILENTGPCALVSRKYSFTYNFLDTSDSLFAYKKALFHRCRASRYQHSPLTEGSPREAGIPYHPARRCLYPKFFDFRPK